MSMQSDDTTKSILNSRIAARSSMWMAACRNNSQFQISVQDTGLFPYIAYLHPLTRATMGLVTLEGEKNSGWARTERVLDHSSKATDLVMAAKIVSASLPWTALPALFINLAPDLMTWFKGAESPANSNLQSLNSNATTLAPGSTALVYVFTEHWQYDPKAIAMFSIPVSNLPTVKLAQ